MSLLGMLVATPAADADSAKTSGYFSFQWKAHGGLHDVAHHRAYYHTLEGESARGQNAPDIYIYSRMRNERSWKHDLWTPWLLKDVCQPDSVGRYKCNFSGRMGPQWDDQQLKYQAVGGRAAFTGRVTFRYYD